jgi:hypothetical protein
MHTIIPGQRPPTDTRLGTVMELNARCIAAAAVLGDYKAEVASAPVTRPPGREWMLRLASVLEDLLTALDDPAEADEDDGLDGLEPYCAECGAWVGIFRGHGDGWHHWRGRGTAASPVELYDAGHEPVVAWCQPPGQFVSPADAATIAQALADAEAYRRERAAAYCYDCSAAPQEACEAHLDDLDQADAYAELGRQLQQGEDR